MSHLPGRTMSLDVWSTRERLCLASSVLRSGDQNWVSVSRALKPFGEPNRPADWFSQKNCALQYSDLLEKVETPKRKRGDRTEIETPGECIVRKLTLERIDELKKLVVEERQRYRKLKDELESVRNGQADDRLPTIWADILEKRSIYRREKKIRAEANIAHQKWLQEREVAKQAAAAALRMGKFLPVAKKAQSLESPTKKLTGVVRNNSLSEQSEEPDEIDDIVDVTGSTEGASPRRTPDQVTGLSVCTAPAAAIPPPPPHHSPLLNNLLRNNNSTLSLVHQQQPSPAPSVGAPTIASPPTTPSMIKETSPRSQLSIASPTITSLLSSTTGISTALSSSVVNLFTTALGGNQPTDAEVSPSEVSGQLATSPIQQSTPTKRQSQGYTLAGAPTLLKLLDMPLGAPGILPPLPVLTSEERIAGNNTTMPSTENTEIQRIGIVESETVVKIETEVVENYLGLCEPTTSFVADAAGVGESSRDEAECSSSQVNLDRVVDVGLAKMEAVCKEDTTIIAMNKADDGEIVVLEDPVVSVEQVNPTQDIADANGELGEQFDDVDVKEEVIIDSVDVASSDAVIVVDVTADDMESTTTVIHETIETEVIENLDESEDLTTGELSTKDTSELDDKYHSEIKVTSQVDADEACEVNVESVGEVLLVEQPANDEVKNAALIDGPLQEKSSKEDGIKIVSNAKGQAVNVELDEDRDAEDDDDSNSRLSSATNESCGPKTSETAVRSTQIRRSLRGRTSEQKDSKEAVAISKEAENKKSDEGSSRSTRVTRSRRETISVTSQLTTRKREPSSRGKEHYRREESDSTKRVNKDESLEGSGREDDASGPIVSGSSQTIDSLPNSPSSTIFSDDPESTRDYKLWKKSIMLVWRTAANHKFANVFLHAVTNDMAPGYRSVVYRPMDLIMIKKNIESGAIKTTAEFQRDVMLLFQNAIMYNNSDHDVYQMAIEMQKEILPHIQDYLATQLMVQSAVPKALRSRGETRDQQSAQLKRGTATELTTGATQPDPVQKSSRDEINEQANKKRKRMSSSDGIIVDTPTNPQQTKKRRTRADDW